MFDSCSIYFANFDYGGGKYPLKEGMVEEFLQALERAIKTQEKGAEKYLTRFLEVKSEMDEQVLDRILHATVFHGPGTYMVKIEKTADGDREVKWITEEAWKQRGSTAATACRVSKERVATPAEGTQ